MRLLRCCAGTISLLALGGVAGQMAFAGEPHGKPLIHNYNRRDFGGEVQHWDAIQDDRGIVYFANNAGVVEYDGRAP